MRIVSMSVTEASRNFADCINRARYQGTTFILHKNGTAVARIVPEPKSHKEEELEPAPTQTTLPEAKPKTNAETRVEGAGAAPAEKCRAIW
jgi:antitoxin (DNA-binding transcriptional repressor) of toxin-antitoxin stability system